jgi:hypothetical protein
MPAYEAAYAEGVSVVVLSRQELGVFRDTWRFHHKVEAEQLSFAGSVARVKSIAYYHGGNVLYELEGVPGIWHEQCLRLAEEAD